jgi:hypothetical protein
MKKALGIALILGMILAGIVTIAHARNERGNRIVRQDRREQWDRGRDRIRQWSAVERYRQFWFNTTFMLELDNETLIRAKDVYSRALHDINQEHQTKDRKEIAEEFANNLRKTIGDENFDKLSKSVRSRGSRRDIKIGEDGRNRRKRGGKTGTHKTKNQKKS